ncbi:hypothetical protein J3Q64DRAFT_1885338 [Phycomyces blakesleeanus]|uniref:Uncharacterized protein n=2 Tax=Phycomyces blakesleeanus TaxID=4837 RepID=A0A162TYP6_PHYB8|nr:hypothetical protein PHYBLDRAFT_170967 [Phycomyces blakesleeanus NRRL 1555(-)]OAD70883.1 hypothetical protein PHYBLDRAFT_170967 [Phycomyces blakesleeanus NRRL 1555(-)]|eukprot:XP_018288923.1 hypothetical protein PHYBLDRAFT_170967 [Phycomyces blakesleeanus NRRL 1555(-)]
MKIYEFCTNFVILSLNILNYKIISLAKIHIRFCSNNLTEYPQFSLLVHNDFKDKITQLFADIGVSVKTDFDPLDHRIIADPAHAHKPVQERQQLAYKLHRQRLLALCLRLPAPLGKSVMRHFCTVESSSLRLPPVCLEQYLEDRNLPSGPQVSAIDTATAMVIG